MNSSRGLGTLLRPDGYSDLLFFRQSDLHLMELATSDNGLFYFGDITAAAGGGF
jgi:hypothetical protein